MRAAALARHLQERYGIYLNGLILISAGLDAGTRSSTTATTTLRAVPADLRRIANYHGLHPGRPLREVLDEAEDYAERDYLWVLARGARLTGEERAAAVAKLASLTGLSADYIDRVILRPGTPVPDRVCATSAARPAASTAGSPAGIPITAARNGVPPRSTPSWGRIPPR